jgi:hypothetical protein
VTAALLVSLALLVPLRAPDLQVEARTATGTELPELADAVARALVASGVRVVLGGTASTPCVHCAQVSVTELDHGGCRLLVSQDRHTALANLHFATGSPLFDRARAIAIHARLLVTWKTSPDLKAKAVMVRSSSPRKPEPRSLVDHSVVRTQVAETASVDPPGKESELAGAIQPEPARVELAQMPVPVPPLDPQRRVEEPRLPAAAVKTAERTEAQPVSRPLEPAHPLPQLGTSAEIKASILAPTPRRWPWIPTILGSGAAVAAGICAVVARNRYNALSDKSQPYDQASALKTEGEHWQIASYVLSGVAAAGLSTGLIGFIVRPSQRYSVVALTTPISGGGMLSLSGDMP